MSKNATGLLDDVNIWQNGGMVVPAIMTLICFICTSVSLTVSGFICLRDREAQDEVDNKAKHHKEQEFVSKVLGLFYKIRTSNIFRIKEIMSDLNDERPVWIGTKREIIANLEYYGIFLTEKEKSKLMTKDEVFEIDCESLFYFELERFSKAQAIYGSNVLNYFQCIQQDGSAFPREFYPDIKNVFHIDIIYNVFTEMQVITELFVLLATGIDLEIISVYAIPPQFRYSQLGNELSKIKDFLYNYYKRVFPTERSTANVMRKLPLLPIVYEKILSNVIPETVETIVEIEEEEDVYQTPVKKVEYGSVGSISSISVESIPDHMEEDVPSRSYLKAPPSPTPSTASRIGASARRRLSGSFGKQKVKMVKVYQKLSDRVKQRPSYTPQDDTSSLYDPEEFPTEQPSRKTSSMAIIREDLSDEEITPKRSDDQVPFPAPSAPVKQKKKKTVSKRVRVIKDPAETQDAILENMKFKYKAPVKRESSNRRRGMLSKQVIIEHNAFTYMVTRVLAFLKEQGHLSDEELNGEEYSEVDRNFII